jgi:hypothetical protein
MSYGSIYKIVFPNGKHYIGLTTSIEQRTKEHRSCAKSGDNKCLYNAIRKYDMIDNLELIEIDTADTNEELCEKEIRYIQEYNSYYLNENGYNMTYGGEGFNGYVRTEEDKLKMSESQKKRFENPAIREQMSNIKKQYFENPQVRQEQSERIQKYHEENPDAGKEQGERLTKYYEDNPEARQRQRDISTKQWESQVARQQMSEIKKQYYEEHPNAGKEHSEKLKQYYEDNPEARQRMSNIKKKQFEDNPEIRKKLSESHKKLFEKPEAKQKMIDAQKQYWANPEARQAQRERITNAIKNNPEIQKKMSDSQKQYWANPEVRQAQSERTKKYYKEQADSKGLNKPFDLLASDGTFIQTFIYQFEAREYLKTEHGITSTICIGEVLSGKRTNSHGFIFKYK